MTSPRWAEQAAGGTPSGDPPRVLVICHASAADAAAAALRTARPIDMLCYGRAAQDRPPPPGARFVAAAAPDDPAGTLRRLAGLRRGGYELVALAQPQLGLSRARGVL